MLFLILYFFNAISAISSYSVNPESYDFFPTKLNHLPSEDVEIIKFSDNKPIFYFNDLYSRQYRLIFSKNQSDWSFTLFFEDLIPSNEAYAIFVIDFFGEKSMKFEVIFMEEPAIVNDDLADPIKRKLIKLVINNENWAVFDVTKNSDFPKEFTFTVQKNGIFEYNESHNFMDVSFAKYFMNKPVIGEYIVSFQMKSNFYLVYPNEKHPNFESTVIERSRSIYYFSKGSVIRFFILIFATIFPFYLFTKILKKFQYATVESEVHLKAKDYYFNLYFHKERQQPPIYMYMAKKKPSKRSKKSSSKKPSNASTTPFLPTYPASQVIQDHMIELRLLESNNYVAHVDNARYHQSSVDANDVTTFVCQYRQEFDVDGHQSKIACDLQLKMNHSLEKWEVLVMPDNAKHTCKELKGKYPPKY